MKIRKAIGSTVTLWCELSDPASKEPVDPDTLELIVIAPDGTADGYDIDDIERSEAGKYSMPVLLDSRGTWHWHYSAITETPPRSIVLAGEVDAVPRP